MAKLKLNLSESDLRALLNDKVFVVVAKDGLFGSKKISIFAARAFLFQDKQVNVGDEIELELGYPHFGLSNEYDHPNYRATSEQVKQFTGDEMTSPIEGKKLKEDHWLEKHAYAASKDESTKTVTLAEMAKMIEEVEKEKAKLEGTLTALPGSFGGTIKASGVLPYTASESYLESQKELGEKFPPEKALVDAINEKLSREIAEGNYRFFNNKSPNSFTVAQHGELTPGELILSRYLAMCKSGDIHNVAYKKVPFSGGESLSIFNAYLGKRGDVIIRLYEAPGIIGPRSSDKNAFVEIKMSDALENLSDFGIFIDIVNEYIPSFSKKEDDLAAVFEEIYLAADATAGSW